MRSVDLSILDEKNNVGYGPKTIPCERDDEIQKLIRVWMEANAETRSELVSKITNQHCGTLLAFGERTASRAVRQHHKQDVIDGLIALNLAQREADEREILIALSLLFRSAVIVAGDPKSIFDEAKKYFDNNFLTIIDEFLKRSEEDKSIDVMGFIEGADEDGFRFMRTW